MPSMPREQVYFEPPPEAESLKKLQRIGAHDARFAAVFERSVFRELARSLLGTPAVPGNLQRFKKPPVVGKPMPPHRDGYHFMLEP